MERVCYKAERWAAVDAALRPRDRARRERRVARLPARRSLRAARQRPAQLPRPARRRDRRRTRRSSRSTRSPQAAAKHARGAVQAAQRLAAADRGVRAPRRDPARLAAQARGAAHRGPARPGPRRATPRQSMRLNRKLLDGRSARRRRVGDARAVLRGQPGQVRPDRASSSMRLRSTARRARRRSSILKRIARASEDGARDVETATEHYQKILELQPENRDALEALGRIYESTEQWAELIDVTRRQIKVTTDRNTKALLYFRCGSVMEAKFGREQDAIRYYDAAIKTSPTCLPAVHGLRDLYRRREEWPRVIETLELEVKLWQDDKERAGVFAQIGRIYDKQLGDAERAMQYYDSALAVDPDCLPANQALFEHFFDQRRVGQGAADRQRARAEGDARRRPDDAQRVLPQARRGREDDRRSARRGGELHRRAGDPAGQHRRARRPRRARPRAPRRVGLRRDLPRARQGLQEARRRRGAARPRPRRPRRDPSSATATSTRPPSCTARRSSSRPATSPCCRRSSTSTPTCGTGPRRSPRSRRSSPAAPRRPPTGSPR